MAGGKLRAPLLAPVAAAALPDAEAGGSDAEDAPLSATQLACFRRL